ncbi:MAG: hypothetical protein IJM30_10550 [Thermoguttaceae bacterium]|nr:hypothetical protein [Thermoguttaceae bacterium]
MLRSFLKNRLGKWSNRQNNAASKRVLRVERLENRELLAADPTVWALADYAGYSDYVIEGVDGTTPAPDQIVLYGIDSAGTKTELTHLDVEADSALKIVATGSSAETLTIESSATKIGEIEFDGGSEDAVDVTIKGTAAVDTFAVSTDSSGENVADTAADSGRHGRWDRWDDWGWGWHSRKDSKKDKVEKSSDDITLATLKVGEAETAFTVKGAASVTLDGDGGADVYKITSVADDVVLVSDGTASVDFSDADTGTAQNDRSHRWDDWGWDCWYCGWHSHGCEDSKIDGVTVDFGSSDFQTVSNYWNGRIKLDGTFNAVVGSAKSDKITGSNLKVTETAGKNVVTLTGGDNEVDLKSDGNSVSVEGAGTNSITVSGNKSKIDLSKTTSAAANTVSVSGDRNEAVGGEGADVFVVSGSDNTAKGGAGNDAIWAVAATGWGSYSGGDGDDLIFGGSGDDWIFGGDGRDIIFGSLGRDELDGGRGQDLIYANRGDLASDLESWDAAKRDAYFASLQEAWIDDADVDATVALIGSDQSDGARDKVYSDRGGEDRVFISDRDRNERGRSWDWWF